MSTPTTHNIIVQYIREVNEQFKTGLAREHSYRPALKTLLAQLLGTNMTVTNEPARIDCGAPDYIITRNNDQMPVFFVEAKDIGDSDLDGRDKNKHREQFDRYRQALDHIIFTDYLDFHLYEHGEWVENVRIGELHGERIDIVENGVEKFTAIISHLAQSAVQRITSARRLAELMAAKARMLAATIEEAMSEHNLGFSNQQLHDQFHAFQNVLIHDLTPTAFADIYAQTIAYGLFAARLHDTTPENFSRQEAAMLIPKTNPFLRQIFQSIAGYDLDERITWIVDDLVSTFAATDIRKIMKNYEKNERHRDPMIHFYEDFLSLYNPKLRKSMGVWYTPMPVVSFIVRAVDEVLRRDFQLPMGLADYSTVERRVSVEQTEDKRTTDGLRRETRKFHRVQILDPATGTGTFLAEAVNQIYDKFRSNQGMWQQYVENHLLPRLNGFEILMASYAVAHLKLDMLLQETGYTHNSDKRMHVYLTNSLEESSREQRTLFANWLSHEANEANTIKRDTPVMVMIGNPPYSISSQNNGEWITQLIADYKKDLNERNIQPLSDDYIKFLRLAQYYIEKNSEGIVGFITNNTYFDGIIHRQMRKRLLEAFDDIYLIDLHGNSKKKETTPNGDKDENVFDIMQGVGIGIFIKTNKKEKGELARVHYHELFGLRKLKYEALNHLNLSANIFKEIKPTSPYYFFVPKDFSKQKEYDSFFKITELFVNNVGGIVTSKDSVNIQDTKNLAVQLKENAINLSTEEFRIKYNTGKDSRDWSVIRAQEDVRENINKTIISEYAYRPFDQKFIVYTGKTNGIVAWPRYRSFACMLHPQNLSLLTTRQYSTGTFNHVFVAASLSDKCTLSSQTKETSYIFPLYNVGSADSIFKKENRFIPNFNIQTQKKIEKKLGEKIEPQELFDYIYAVLHSPSYRERYKEFLKIDFPRIPYPTDTLRYHSLADKGRELRELHLMTHSTNWSVATNYPAAGNNQIEEYRRTEDGKVHINNTQYFDGVSETAWNFYIGGYQPAQKWLKDRKNQTLSFDDIRHYEEIIHALDNTDRIMKEIDSINP